MLCVIRQCNRRQLQWITSHYDLAMLEINKRDWNQCFTFVALSSFVDKNMCKISIAKFTGIETENNNNLKRSYIKTVLLSSCFLPAKKYAKTYACSDNYFEFLQVIKCYIPLDIFGKIIKFQQIIEVKICIHYRSANLVQIFW